MNNIEMQSADKLMRRIVIAVLTLGVALSVFCVLEYSGSKLYWFFFNNIKDSFMDLFNPIVFTRSKNPYENAAMGAIYPPLCYLLYSLFGKAIGPDYYSGYMSASGLRETQDGRIVLLLFTVSFMVLLFYVIYKNARGKEIEKLFIVGALISSAPVLYLVERGNILIISLVLSLFFAIYYDSKNKYLREAALIALAFAAALKIYPAIFGLILIKKKKFPAAIRCVIYGILLVVIPCFAYDGVSTLMQFITNLTNSVGITAGNEFRIDLAQTISWLSGEAGENIGATAPKLSMAASIGFLIVMLICSFVSDKDWKAFLCFSLIGVLLPGFSFFHSAVLYIIPVFLFLQCSERKTTDVIYAVLLPGLLMTVIIPMSWVESNDVFCIFNSVLLCRLSQMFLILTLVSGTVARVIIFVKKSLHGKKETNVLNNN